MQTGPIKNFKTAKDKYNNYGYFATLVMIWENFKTKSWSFIDRRNNIIYLSMIKDIIGVVVLTLQLLTKDRIWRKTAHIIVMYNFFKAMLSNRFFRIKSFRLDKNLLKELALAIFKLFLDFYINISLSSGIIFFIAMGSMTSNPFFVCALFIWADALELCIAQYFLENVASSANDFFDKFQVVIYNREIMKHIREYVPYLIQTLLKNNLINGTARSLLGIYLCIGFVFYYLNMLIKEFLRLLFYIAENIIGIIKSITIFNPIVATINFIIKDILGFILFTKFENIYIEQEITHEKPKHEMDLISCYISQFNDLIDNLLQGFTI